MKGFVPESVAAFFDTFEKTMKRKYNILQIVCSVPLRSLSHLCNISALKLEEK
jgi:hypothetical protein